MAGERRRFRADAFHQAAVAADRVDVVVEDREVGLVVARREPLLRDRHADARRDALAQRSRRRLHARHEVVFGMTRRVAADLAEVRMSSSVTDGWPRTSYSGLTALTPVRCRQRPQQHRRVAVGQHEAIAVGPDRIGGIEAHHAIPQHVGHRRERHRRAGMPGVRRLHRVDRQRADRVDAKRRDVLVAREVRHCVLRHRRTPAGGRASAMISARSPVTRPAGMRAVAGAQRRERRHLLGARSRRTSRSATG